MLTELWGPQEDSLIHVTKEVILLGPVLKRPTCDCPFYVKTDWSSLAKGCALCQPECTSEAEEALRKEHDVRPLRGNERDYTPNAIACTDLAPYYPLLVRYPCSICYPIA